MKYRILLPIATVLIISTLAMATYSSSIIENVFMEQTKQQALVWLYGIEREIIHQVPDLDSTKMNDIIRYRPASGDEFNYSISRIYIYDIDGNILADTNLSSEKKKNVADYHRDVITSGKVFMSEEVEHSLDARTQKHVAKFDVIIPLHKHGLSVAGLEAEINVDAAVDAIQRLDDAYESSIMWMLGIGFFGVSLIVFLVIHRSVVAPINSVMGVTEDIAAGALNTRVDTIKIPEFLRLGNSINHMAASIEELLLEQEESYMQMMQSLAKALEAKDRYTASHSGRVANFSVKLGKRIGLDEEQLMLLKKGALLHDLGKIGIPDAVLNKPEPLNDSEYELMKAHPINTANIMRPLKRFTAFTEIAAWHHERWDGNGYPDGLKGEEIPLLARIVSIADTWDAMTGDRVYRKGMSIEKALGILSAEQHFGQWDPTLVEHFISMIRAEQQAREEVEHDMFE